MHLQNRRSSFAPDCERRPFSNRVYVFYFDVFFYAPLHASSETFFLNDAQQISAKPGIFTKRQPINNVEAGINLSTNFRSCNFLVCCFDIKTGSSSKTPRVSECSFSFRCFFPLVPQIEIISVTLTDTAQNFPRSATTA